VSIIKSTPQFSIWCDYCKNFEDFTAFENRRIAVNYFRSIGWAIGRKVKCPDCKFNVSGGGVEVTVSTSIGSGSGRKVNGTCDSPPVQISPSSSYGGGGV
jgi:hypothetical protein